jgi:hypothetical protein
MPVPLNPQLYPTLTGIDALAAVGQPQPNPQLAQAGGLSGDDNSQLVAARESGNPGLRRFSGPLDPRLRGGDETDLVSRGA